MMNESARVTCRPRRAWPPTTRTAAVIIATAGLALLAAACGGGRSSTTSTGSVQDNGALAFSRCMRSHGVPHFPDPASSGGFVKETPQQLGVISSQFQAAQNACQHLLPTTNPPRTTQAEVQQALSGMVRFAACMRSRGVQQWPDPQIDRHHPGDPRPVFNLPSIDPNAPGISADIHACQHLMPGSTSPYLCSRVLAERIGGPPGAFACTGGSARVP